LKIAASFAVLKFYSMRNVRWLGVCRWVHPLVVLGYVFATILMTIVSLVVFGVRIPNGVRWMMMVGWFAICFGSAFLLERMGLFCWPGCRRPIKSEEERLSELMVDVRKRMNSTDKAGPEVRFLIGSDAKRQDGSWGSRTIIVGSGTFKLASDEELRGILAHEFGHLLDGDRILAMAFFCSGVLARGFRLSWQLIRRGFRLSVAGGFVLFALLSPVLLSLFFFFCMDSVFSGLIWGLERSADFRQDCRTVRSGCGRGLRDWLEKSGLAANVDRIRRLEKML
jgi:hypothetical protein